MLYKLKSGVDPKTLNPGLEAVEAFNKLTDQQLFFVLILCDPSKDNPIKTLTGRERRERAAILAGYKLEPNGKRLARNGRSLVYGEVRAVEEAIEEYKRNNYNQVHHSKEALRKQIVEIRDFLESDKRIPLLDKGKIILDKNGKEIYITDQKGLKLAVELGIQLPNLEEALKRLEDANPEDTKFEGTTFTSYDLEEPPTEGDETLNVIELFHRNNKKND